MAVNQETVGWLLVQHGAKLHAYTWQFVQDDHLAEDILQDMVVLALKKCNQINDEAHFPAWARQTCRNLAMNALRKRGHHAVSLSNAVLDQLECHWKKLDTVVLSDSIVALRKCMERLAPQARQIIEMRYADDLRPNEVAERLGLKINTVYMAMMRTHRTLAECVERERGEPFDG
jgi:RNA polymerase sigma-70 factor (ECF subfamily)